MVHLRRSWKSLLLSALTLPIVYGSLQAKPPLASAKAALEKFLVLDSQAAGLSAETWPELGALTTWVTAPGWDTFTIIRRYEISKVMEGKKRAQVTVTYYPLGRMSDGFAPETKNEVVVYHLNKVGNEWKVDGPQLNPHVSYEVMKARLEARSAQDPKAKAGNDALLQQIEAVRQGNR